MVPIAATHSASSCPDVLLARLGRFDVRLAASPQERHAAYRLRYEVFHTERGVDVPWLDHDGHLEYDAFDAHCDHLIVLDRLARPIGSQPAIVGTYRIMTQPAPGLGYYAQGEFDLAGLFSHSADQRFCEVGRSCVAPAYRTMRTVEALWCGLWAYACRNGIDVFFGAASFPGTDPRQHGLALGHLARTAVLPNGPVPRNDAGFALDTWSGHTRDRHKALRAMPPLVRAYLRVNARFAPFAYVDHAFGTTDVLVVAPLAQSPKPYRDRLERVTGERLVPPVEVLDA